MQIEDKYFDKYIKYKKKYLDLKQKINHSGGFFECIGDNCFEKPDESASVKTVIKDKNGNPTSDIEDIIVVPEDYDDKIFDFFAKQLKVEHPRKITKIILEGPMSYEKEIYPDDTFVTARIFNKETGNNYKDSQKFNIHVENEQDIISIKPKQTNPKNYDPYEGFDIDEANSQLDELHRKLTMKKTRDAREANNVKARGVSTNTIVNRPSVPNSKPVKTPTIVPLKKSPVQPVLKQVNPRSPISKQRTLEPPDIENIHDDDDYNKVMSHLDKIQKQLGQKK